MRMWVGRTLVLLTATAVALPAVGCGGSDDPPVSLAPADLLMSPDDLPSGFTATQLSVGDLVKGNQESIDAAADAEVTPAQCRPTADADLNKQLNAGNSAVLAAAGAGGPNNRGGSLVELITTAARNIIADAATSTGACARTTTVLRGGNLAGTRIETEFGELAAPAVDGVERSLVVRSVVTTTFADGSGTRQLGYAGYATVRPRGTDAPVTVQLTVAGAATQAASPVPTAIEPISEQGFLDLFGSSLHRASAR